MAEIHGVQLTSRETQCVEGLARSCSQARIGRDLGVTRGTVSALCCRAYRKLGVRNSTAAVLKAIRLGIIRPPFRPPDGDAG